VHAERQVEADVDHHVQMCRPEVMPSKFVQKSTNGAITRDRVRNWPEVDQCQREDDNLPRYATRTQQPGRSKSHLLQNVIDLGILVHVDQHTTFARSAQQRIIAKGASMLPVYHIAQTRQSPMCQ